MEAEEQTALGPLTQTVQCWLLYSRQSPAPEAPLAPGYTAAAASQRTEKDVPVSARLTYLSQSLSNEGTG